MFGQKKDWETRENAFAAFSMGPLTDFWRQREEAEFKGVDDVPVRFVRFCTQNNDRLVLICPGRIESYVKYAEVAYDLFHSGFDVMIIDHRGQGRSGRLLSDTHRGHVVNFSDYVDDLAALWQQQVVPGHWRKRFILAHSMGGAIATLFCNVTRRIAMRLRSAHRCSGLSFDCRTGWCAIFSTGLRPSAHSRRVCHRHRALAGAAFCR
ncbi:Lysophospholipase L2 [Klebsiella variicola]|uniref:Lysophospholipase L2 n=1 Tax=Klebsiella variicola TaxID=244366 RepID=A0A7H4MAZ4_KLEVA|nr:Lysophospholipase L2 [Klebsiella variicola]